MNSIWENTHHAPVGHPSKAVQARCMARVHPQELVYPSLDHLLQTLMTDPEKPGTTMLAFSPMSARETLGVGLKGSSGSKNGGYGRWEAA